MKIVLEPWAVMPTRAHEFDAGLDLYSAREDTYIYPHESALFDTGVHVQLPNNTVGFLKSKSGLNVKKRHYERGRHRRRILREHYGQAL